MSDYNISDLIDFLSRMPGVGSRLARKMVISMMKDKERLMVNFANIINDVSAKIQICSECRNIDIRNPCGICQLRQSPEQICIVGDIDDLWNIEKANVFSGIYYVLGGYLSTTSSVMPGDLKLENLCEVIKKRNIQEVIFALGSTVAAQTTYFFALDEIEKFIKSQGLNTKITSLAFGIPMGIEIDYLDENTISEAMRGRK